MKALAISSSSTGVQMVERAEPEVAGEDEIKVRVLRVGICGTDREEVTGGRIKLPPGQAELVIGHEMFGQVVDAGKKVTRIKVGDFGVFTVRRGCGTCLPCLMNRPDMCRTGDYTERGIWGKDGYQTEFVVDTEQYIVQLPAELEPVGVLLEPLSVSEKAIDEALRVQQARLPDFQSTPHWLFAKRCLVAGLGPVGLLAAMILRLRGADVYGLDVVDAESVRPRWLSAIGGHYIDGRKVKTDTIDETFGAMDLVFEATGVAELEFNLLDTLADNGVYVLTGLPGEDRPLEVKGAEMVRRLVLNNQAMIGSVNASRDHFQMAVDDLRLATHTWSGHVATLITHRFPYTDYAGAFSHHGPDEIKTVIEWSA